MTTNTVTTEPAAFASGGDELRGELFLPANGHGPADLPAVVVIGTWTSVRQQMTDRYARERVRRAVVRLRRLRRIGR